MFGLGRDSEAPEVWIPPGGVQQLDWFGAQFGTPAIFRETFRLQEYAERQSFVTATGLTVTPFEVPHYTTPTYAFRITDGERTLTYSGDSAPSDALVEAAREADLFLCEATLKQGREGEGPRGHLAADEAVDTFERSGAKRLVIIHRPHELGL